MWENQICNGYDLRKSLRKRPKKFHLHYFMEAYELLKGETFVTNAPFLNRLIGNDQLMKQIEEGMSETKIRATWQQELVEFKIVRARYLLY